MQYFLHLILFMIISIYISFSTQHLQFFYILKNSLEFNKTLIHLFNFSLIIQFNLLLMIYYCNSLYSKQIPSARALLFHYLSFMILYIQFLLYVYYFIIIQSFLMN